MFCDPEAPVASISFGGVQKEFPMRRLLDDVAPGLVKLATTLSASISQNTTAL
jgi:hypothetical protein